MTVKQFIDLLNEKYLQEDELSFTTSVKDRQYEFDRVFVFDKDGGYTNVRLEFTGVTRKYFPELVAEDILSDMKEELTCVLDKYLP